MPKGVWGADVEMVQARKHNNGCDKILIDKRLRHRFTKVADKFWYERVFFN